MVAVIQRVSSSSVRVDGEEIARIGRGLNILLGVVDGDDERDIDRLVEKIVHLRIFADSSGRMNKSLLDIEGEVLAISQFTLAASLKKGRRPSFEKAMEAEAALALYELFCNRLGDMVPLKMGRFGAMMSVDIQNDGPVTFILDSKEL